MNEAQGFGLKMTFCLVYSGFFHILEFWTGSLGHCLRSTRLSWAALQKFTYKAEVSIMDTAG